MIQPPEWLMRAVGRSADCTYVPEKRSWLWQDFTIDCECMVVTYDYEGHTQLALFTEANVGVIIAAMILAGVSYRRVLAEELS